MQILAKNTHELPPIKRHNYLINEGPFQNPRTGQWCLPFCAISLNPHGLNGLVTRPADAQEPHPRSHAKSDWLPPE